MNTLSCESWQQESLQEVQQDCNLAHILSEFSPCHTPVPTTILPRIVPFSNNECANMPIIPLPQQACKYDFAAEISHHGKMGMFLQFVIF